MALRVPRGELDGDTAVIEPLPPHGHGPGGAGDGQVVLAVDSAAERPPHVTTIAAVWLDGAVHFTTGERERKATNLARNPLLHRHHRLPGPRGPRPGRRRRGDAGGDGPRATRARRGVPAEIRSAVSLRGARRGPVPPGHRRPRPRVSTPREEGPRLWQGRPVQPDPLAPLGTPVQPRPSRSRRC